MGFCCFHLLISLLLLLCSTQLRFLADGRDISKLLEVPNKRRGGGEGVVVRDLIGSRPPRCERRCTTCGHCEAVQVPAVPQGRNGIRHSSGAGIDSRGDDSSNYKPMSWKCKCGDVIINP